jgi:hypothetical protein
MTKPDLLHHPDFWCERAFLRAPERAHPLALIHALNSLATPDPAQNLAGLHLLSRVLTSGDPPSFSLFLRRMTVVPSTILAIAVTGSDPAIQRSALHCLSRICLLKLHNRQLLDDIQTSLSFLLELCNSEDFEIVSFGCVILSFASLHRPAVTELICTADFLNRMLQFPNHVLYGRLFFSMIRIEQLQGLIPIEHTRHFLSQMMTSESPFNVRFALKSYLKIGAHPEFASEMPGLFPVLGNCLQIESHLVRLATLKLLSLYSELPIEILAVIYSRLNGWNARCSILGLGLFGRFFEQFISILVEMDIDVLLHLILEADMKVKRAAFKLFCMVNEASPIDDTKVLEPLLVIAADEECGEVALQLIVSLEGRYEAAGRMGEFVSSLAEIEGVIEDLELSPNPGVAAVAGALDELLTAVRA